jgi:hypothetical protein
VCGLREVRELASFVLRSGHLLSIYEHLYFFYKPYNELIKFLTLDVWKEYKCATELQILTTDSHVRQQMLVYWLLFQLFYRQVDNRLTDN